MEKLYLECYSGISGDMMAAALLDLGADSQKLKKILDDLPIDGFRTEISRVKKAGLDVCDFSVILEEDNHDHDMEYLHGNSNMHHEHHHHEHPHGDHCEHEHHHHEHPHGDHCEHEHHHHHDHVHRGLDDILEIIHKSAMSERAKKSAEDIFLVLAEAESKAHGVPMEQVHFHEVGAVDSIVDIVAIAVCLDDLDIGEVIVPVLYEGRGTVRCQHGILPVPVPAVINIVNSRGLTLHLMDEEGEFVTPTGAAVVASIRTSEKLPERFRIVRTGIGAGKRKYKRPSMLRAMIIEEV